MPEYGKIAILENEIEAGLLESVLTEMGIPHAIRSYYDQAYDGLFQMQKGWGCIEADLEHKEEIEEVLAELRHPEEETDQD